MDRQSHTAIVTGASRGLGAVIARVLAGGGVNLVLNAREEAPLRELSEALSYAGVRITPVAGDVASAPVQQRVVDEAVALGGLAILVNNASALGRIEPLVDAPADLFAQVLATNLMAPVALA